jgi:hypothetical protein
VLANPVAFQGLGYSELPARFPGSGYLTAFDANAPPIGGAAEARRRFTAVTGARVLDMPKLEKPF